MEFVARRGRYAAAAVTFMVLLGSGETSAAGTRSHTRVTASATLGTARVIVIRGAVRPPRTSSGRILLYRHKHGRWVKATHSVRIRHRGRFTVRFRPKASAARVTLRVAYVAGGRRIARSRNLTLRIARNGSSVFSVPRTTRLYGRTSVARVRPASAGDDAVLTLSRGARRPIVGGHVAVAPVSGLPDGIFAKVVSASHVGGRWRLVLRRAPMDQVLANVSVNIDRDVVPRVVAADGRAVPDAARAHVGRASAAGLPFTCEESGGLPRRPEQVWDTGLPLPISIDLERTHIIHRFDQGGVFRKPYLLLQLSGDAVAKVGFEAKTGFKCRLSDRFRVNHRIQIPVAVVAGVPVTAYLEPTLEFGVSASGKVAFEQRHYFAITLEKDGFAPLKYNRASSTGATELHLDSELNAELFAGGDLSLMVGGGVKAASVGAGLYGAFGPDYKLTIGTEKAGCITSKVRLKAELGVRLQVFVKRWSLELASLSSPEANAGGPWCPGADDGGGEDGGGDDGGSNPPPDPGDGRGDVKLVVADGDPYGLGPVMWSPDGSKLLFGGHTFDPNTQSQTNRFPFELFVADLSSGGVALLTAAPPGEPLPLVAYSNAPWSPDGSQVGLAVSTGDGGWRGYIKDLASGALTPLSASSPTCDGPLSDPVWSQDGTRYAAVLGTGSMFQGAGVCVIDRSTGDAVLISARADGQAASDAGNPVWSPDGQKVAFISEDENLVPGLGRQRSRNIFVKNLVTGSLTGIEADSRFDDVLIGPTWNADGTKLAYATSTSLVAADGNNLPDIYVGDAGSGATRLVTAASDGGTANGRSGEVGFMWSPTEPSQLAFTSNATNLLAGVASPPDPYSPANHIYVKNVATASLRGVDLANATTFGNASAAEPWWSPDGRSIAFGSNASDLMSGVTGQHIYAQQLSTGKRTLVSNLTSSQPNWQLQTSIEGSLYGWYHALGTWSPDCRRIAFFGTPTNEGSNLYVSDLGQACS
jgi:Tol biopolymer transport system component